MNDNIKVPEGWKFLSVEKDIILISGIRPKGGASSEGIPSLGGEHITQDGRINFSNDNAKYIPKNFFKLMTKGKAHENDILINKDGANTGKVAILKKKFFPDIAVNEHIFIIRSKGFFEQKYLFYWLFSRFGQKQIKDKITGSAQPGLTSTFTKNLFVLSPPLPEQQKIAEILETVDNAIEKTEKIIEKYKRIKQGLMQDLLTKGIDENGKIRSEKTHKFKDSPLGRIPEEWEVVRLGEVGKIVTGSTPPTINPEYYGDVYQFITPEDIQENKYINSTQRYLSPKGFKIQREIPPNCVCVVCIGSTIGKVALTTSYCSTNQQINTIIPNELLYFETLYYLLLFYAQDQLKIEAGLQALPIVNKKKFSNILIPLPPLLEQQRIAEILSQIDNTIEKEEAYRQKLERIKKGLMEDLLTGRVRVNKLIKEKEA